MLVVTVILTGVYVLLLLNTSYYYLRLLYYNEIISEVFQNYLKLEDKMKEVSKGVGALEGKTTGLYKWRLYILVGTWIVLLLVWGMTVLSSMTR